MALRLLIACLLIVGCSSSGNRSAEAPLRGKLGHIAERPTLIDFYKSVQPCAFDRRLSEPECLHARTVAMKKHPFFAEKFAQRAVCEEIYGTGECDSYTTSTSTFFKPSAHRVFGVPARAKRMRTSHICASLHKSRMGCVHRRKRRIRYRLSTQPGSLCRERDRRKGTSNLNCLAAAKG